NLRMDAVSLRQEQPSDVEINFTASDYTPQQPNVRILKRNQIDPPAPWTLLTSIFPGATSFTDVAQNTSKGVIEYRVETNNLCNFVISSPIHNTILLEAEADRAAGTSKLRWNPYANWGKGVLSYEIWRKRDTDFDFVLYDKVDGNSTSYER